MSSKSRSLGDLLQRAKADAPAAPRRLSEEAPPLVGRTVALTPAAQETLDRLMAEVSTMIGRKASASAVIRALLTWVEQEQIGGEQLTRFIEAELQTGEVVWGRGKTRRQDKI